jgi:hypothetical protein
MAANKQQGSYLTLFWTALTFLCAGLAFLTVGLGKLVLALGIAGVVLSLIGFLRIKPLEGATPSVRGSAAMKLAGLAVTWGGWLITIAGLAITSSTSGRLVFALVGIGVSLVGILGVLPAAFGRKTAGVRTEARALKPTMEHTP